MLSLVAMKIRVDALQRELGLKNKSELARWFGIEPQAVYQWNDYLPRLRAYDMVRQHPDLERLAEDRAA